MASIHKVKETYYCSFRFGGKQFKPSLKTKSRRKAEQRRGQIEETLQLIERGTLITPVNATRHEILTFILSDGKLKEKPQIASSASLKAVIDLYFDTGCNGKEEDTIDGERVHSRHLLRLIGEETLFDRIDYDILQKYATDRKQGLGQNRSSISPKTIEKEFRTFNLIWKFALRKEVVTGGSPTKEVKLDLIDEPEPFRTWNEIESIIGRGNLSPEEQSEYWDCLFLDEQQVLDLVNHVQKTANHPFIYAAISMAAFSGARRAEIMRSRLEDWNFSDGYVRIRGRKDSRTHRTTYRDVTLHPKLATIMQQWFLIHPGGVYTISVPPQLSRSKTKRDNPAPMTKGQAHNHFKAAMKGSRWAVIKGWHVLRHSFCSNCARRGVPDAIIDEWMGHRGDEAVKKRYRHLFPTDKQEFMKRLFVDELQN